MLEGEGMSPRCDGWPVGGGGHEFNTGFVDKGFRQCMTAVVSLKLVGLGGHTMSGLVPFLYAVDCSVKQWAATLLSSGLLRGEALADWWGGPLLEW